MAGASGGRKSICPGLLGEEGTRVFHGPALMSHPNTRDLLIEGNPVHEESLAVARLAGADFIANVTVDSRFRATGSSAEHSRPRTPPPWRICAKASAFPSRSPTTSS